MDKQPEIRTKRTGFLGNEDGIMAVIFALLLPVFVVIAALSIDMGYSYWKRNIVQVDASVSALAGAGIAMDDAELEIDGSITYTLIDKDGDGAPDSDDSDLDGVLDGAVILIEALAYAEKTIAGEDILAVVDVLPGNWEPTTRVFTRAGTWNAAGEFTVDPAAYDTATGTWTPVAAPVTPLNAVMTTTRRADDGPNNNPLPLFLAAAVGMPEININTSAIATFEGGESIGLSACITALNRTEDRSFYINGTAEVLAPGCDIDIYSSDECALYAVGNPGITLILTDAEGNIVEEGEINIGGGYCVTPKVDLEPDEPNDYLYAESTDAFPEGQEPFSYIYPPGGAGTCDTGGNYCGLFYSTIYDSLDPEVANPEIVNLRPTGAIPCDGTESETVFHIDDDYPGRTMTLGIAGGTVVFCGGLKITGASASTVVFAGDIVISGGEFEIQASVSIDSDINGTGFYLMDAARVNWHGSPGGDGAVGLVAQYAGALKDFVFFEDPNSVLPDGVSHSLRGTPLGAFDGILYFQNSDVEFKGTADALIGITDGGCSILIADEIYFNGTTLFAADSSGCGGRTIPPAALGELYLRLRS